MRSFIAIFCLLATTGCYLDSPTIPSPIDIELTLAPGQSAAVPGAPVSVKFTGVTGDNRCPADALCVLAGSATVKLEAAGSSGLREIAFETGEPRPVAYDGLTLELVQLSPYPFSATPIQPSDYRATVRIRR